MDDVRTRAADLAADPADHRRGLRTPQSWASTPEPGRRTSRPEPPSRAVPRVDGDDPLAAYHKRRRPPLDVWRRHRPPHGGGGHLRPGEARASEEWDGFAYAPAGTAANLAEARRWVNEQAPDDEPAA
ncbi:DUF6087 family protein [Streptomyces sp. NPDC056160]|uniref:DUF6087 family protein n=1 Tax=Streptomyces sp. NPDC056160 TaxID=3345731 RepID=UPI0035D7B869